MEALKELYDVYRIKAYEVRKGAALFADFLGFGGGSKNHPCHDEFYYGVEKWVKEFAATQPDSASAAQVSLYLLEEPAKDKDACCYWFMYVCAGFIRELIPFLSKEDCGMLFDRMNELYKKRERMPVHEEVYKQLKKRK